MISGLDEHLHYDFPSTDYLDVADHVDALLRDVLGVLAEELEDVLDGRLEGQPAQPDAVPLRAARYQLLRQLLRSGRREFK